MKFKLHTHSTNHQFDGFFASHLSVGFYVLSIVFIAALLCHFDLAPLEETHLDAAIYVQLAKLIAETHILVDYHQHAHDIPLEPVGALWYFTRIGHVLLLGEIVRLLGATDTALVTMQWLYRIFMAVGVTLCLVLSSRLTVLFRSNQPDPIWWSGYLIAAITYIASDSYRGLQGHLLSEPPAFIALALFAATLVKAIERRSLAVGAFSGFLLFLLFFIRIDAILPGLMFLATLLAALAISKKYDTIPSIIATGVVSLALYLLYAWWYFPLANPQTLASFSSAATEMFPGAPAKSLFGIIIAGGLLWVGACAAIPMWRDPLVRFAMIWLGLTLLPLVVDSLSGRSVNVRMAFYIALPLLVLAGEGWSRILRDFINQRKILPLAGALGLIAILTLTPYSLIIQESRHLAANHLPPEIQKYLFPSMAKSGVIGPAQEHQDSRLGLLVRPIGERITVDYSKAREIGNYLYFPERPVYLLLPEVNALDLTTLRSHLRLFRYFGKKYPNNYDATSITLYPDNKRVHTVNTGSCMPSTPTDLEPVVFCSYRIASNPETLLSDKISLYILTIDGYPFPDIPLQKLKPILSTPPLKLYEIAE
ncbi:MAG: hypothetical protein LZF61_05480 [Nitrosomonas sp.]|nr:MAG: hypothetical protein LZF61_05480 [Nitrosomonas sp.]